MERLFARDFSEIGASDVPLVGGKNASLGEMYHLEDEVVAGRGAVVG